MNFPKDLANIIIGYVAGYDYKHEKRICKRVKQELRENVVDALYGEIDSKIRNLLLAGFDYGFCDISDQYHHALLKAETFGVLDQLQKRFQLLNLDIALEYDNIGILKYRINLENED